MMARKEIPDSAIELVAKHINARSNKNYGIPVVGNEDNIETPQIFEIVSFDQIDNSDARFYGVVNNVRTRKGVTVRWTPFLRLSIARPDP